MALSQARKKANAKYEAKAYDKTLIRLPKGRLDEIRAHIEPAGESLNGFIGRAILEAMERDGGGATSGTAGKGLESTQGDGVVSLPSETAKDAQEAAEWTGEALLDYVARAVKTQVQRDKASLRMGINPATGKRIKAVEDSPAAPSASPTTQQSPTGAVKAKADIDPEKIAQKLQLMFRGMELRCYATDTPEYPRCGAKGVTICDEWRGNDGFSKFSEWCMKNGYRPGLLIDRRDAAGPYSPDNCILKAR